MTHRTGRPWAAPTDLKSRFSFDFGVDAIKPTGVQTNMRAIGTLLQENFFQKTAPRGGTHCTPTLASTGMLAPSIVIRYYVTCVTSMRDSVATTRVLLVGLNAATSHPLVNILPCI